MQLETQQPTRQAEHDLVFQVRAAQADPAAADTLIGQYMPFIRSETYKFTHAPIEAGHEDELSIATLAFYEAALSYQKGRGAFLPYAAAAIRNRLIDHYRAERRHGGSVSLDAPAGEDGGRKRVYRITQAGWQAAERELERLRQVAAAAEEILKEGQA